MSVGRFYGEPGEIRVADTNLSLTIKRYSRNHVCFDRVTTPGKVRKYCNIGPEKLFKINDL